MLEAVARHGYAETTVGELVALAGVSKSTFYAHFVNKEECFLATFETIVREATRRVAIAYRSESSLERRFVAAFTRFAEIVVEESEAASLVMVDALSLGETSVGHRNLAAASFENMFHQSFRSANGHAAPSALTVRAIVGGLWRVVYQRLRADCPDELHQHIDALREWALSYQSAEPPATTPLARAHERRNRPGPQQEQLPVVEPPDSARSRAVLTQRERILRAAVQVAAEQGYEKLTIPSISARAGTSNQTFYEHFKGKEDAFIAGFRALGGPAVRATAAASAGETEWRASVQSGLRGLLEHIAREPLFARVAFFELPTAGAKALDHADAIVRQFTAFLEPEAIPRELAPPPRVVVEAIGGGMWAAIEHEIVRGDVSSLPAKAPEIAAIALTPLSWR
jgi:AcrR family transcriptional regulator